MTNYTELKRLAEAAESFKPTNLDLINPNYMAKAQAAHIAFADKAPPDVVLSMIDALDVQAGSIEAVQAANQRLAAERDKLRTQNQALIAAIKGFHTWAYGQRKQQSKGGHASFDYMELREQMDIAEAALAQAEGGV